LDFFIAISSWFQSGLAENARDNSRMEVVVSRMKIHGDDARFLRVRVLAMAAFRAQ
jgi:hypothetical protein